MKSICPFCSSNNLGIGYYLGNGRLFVDAYAYHSVTSSSEIEVKFCKNCGYIICQRVLRPEIFSQYNDERERELLEAINTWGLLLCNETKGIPSIVGLGFSMENVIGLINRRQIVYSKVYQNKATFLSVKVYQLLKKCFEEKPLTETAKQIYDQVCRFDCIDKREIRTLLDMSKKDFEKGFDLLLHDLKITAISAKKINYNWYSYIYIADYIWEAEMEGLHYSGDYEKLLWSILHHTLTEKQFVNMISY